MVSKDTVVGIAKELVMMVGPEQALRLVQRLRKVPGNKSFRDTIAAVETLLRRDYGPSQTR